MIFEYRQMNSGQTRQIGMPLVVYVFAQYAFEANDEFKQLGGYFGRRDGDCENEGDECCGDRWVVVEQADGFWDEDIQEIAQDHLVGDKRLWRSKTYIDDEGYDGVEEFWVAIVK